MSTERCWFAWVFALIVAGVPSGALADHENKALERVGDAAQVFEEIMSAPDQAIPRDLLDKAYCVGIIPSMKRGGFIFGPVTAKASYSAGVQLGGVGPVLRRFVLREEVLVYRLVEEQLMFFSLS
jgi:lipid-binding SYLF domain-containing protein